MASLGCAIYTRKSSEEGLEQGFNSLDAQREACEAYIQSQKSQGWKASSARYDDGGFSGGNMNRPALQRLLADVQGGRLRIIVVYKVDRLTRSLADFAKLVELFDAHGVSFVSVTQQFNTTTSMGRLTLNVLLSFAQFEREVTGERIRDKIAASKRKGMWMGGMVPIGYRAEGRTLAIEEAQAERVREIFSLYLSLGCVSRLKEALDAKGWTTPARKTNRAGAAGNRPFSRGHLYRILGNAIYVGRISHKGQVFDGEHPAIVDETIWQQVQERLAANRQGSRRRANSDTSSLLTGLVFDAQGNRLTPSHTAKGPKRYRYYAGPAGKDGEAGALRVPAQELDGAVMGAMVSFLGDEVRLMDAVGGSELREAQRVLRRASELSAKLAVDGAEAQVRTDAVQELVQRVIVRPSRLQIRLRPEAFDLPGADAIDPERLSIDVPMQIKRGGRVSRLVIGGGAVPIRRTDPKLIALVAKAQDWFHRLRSGRSPSVEAIAQAEAVSGSYVTRLIYLAFLGPDIVERIQRGEQPVELSVDRIQRLVPLPACWHEQRSLLGIEG